MAARSPEDVLSGLLRISVGGVEKEVPTLPIRAARDWHKEFQAAQGKSDLAPLETWTPADVSEYNNRSIDVVLDMLVEYDRTGALGGREWLEEHADAAQLRTAIDQVLEVLFPFADDVTSIRAVLILRRVVRLGFQSSTNGRSRTGVSTRRPLKAVSTRAS